MELPTEIVALILHNLDDPKHVVSAGQVAKCWRDAASEDFIWKRLYKLVYGPWNTNSIDDRGQIVDCWKPKFINAYENVKSIGSASNAIQRWATKRLQRRSLFSHVYLDENDHNIGYFVVAEYDGGDPDNSDQEADGGEHLDLKVLVFDRSTGHILNESEPMLKTQIERNGIRCIVKAQDKFVIWTESHYVEIEEEERKTQELVIFDIQTRQTRRLSLRTSVPGDFVLSPDGRMVYLELCIEATHGPFIRSESCGLVALDIDQDELLWNNASIMGCKILGASDKHVIVYYLRVSRTYATKVVSAINISDGSEQVFDRIWDAEIRMSCAAQRAFFLGDDRCVVVCSFLVFMADLRDGKLLQTIFYTEPNRKGWRYQECCSALQCGLLFIHVKAEEDQTHQGRDVVFVYDTSINASGDRDKLIGLHSIEVPAAQGESLVVCPEDFSMILASSNRDPSVVCIKLESHPVSLTDQ